MEISIDIETINDAGFDKYLARIVVPTNTTLTNAQTIHTDSSSLVGGIIGSEGIIFLGSKQVRLDGKNKRIVINDGVTDRVIIGYLG